MEASPKILIPHLHVRQKSLESAYDVKKAIEETLPDARIVVAESRQESLQEARTADIIVSKGVTNELLDQSESLQWIQALSSGLGRFTTDRYGYDPPGLERLREDGIVLTNAAGIHAEPTGEQVLGYMLVFEREIHQGVRQQQERVWDSYGPHGELVRKTLGILGVGAIGGRVAELGSGLEMEVIGTKRDTDTVNDAVDEIYSPDSIDELLRRADYLVVSCPLTDQTRDLLGEEEFERMRSDAVLVNIARGEIVAEGALVDALKGGKIRGAALDVFREEPLPETSPLWDLSNVVITPHMAGGSPNGLKRIADLFATNYRHFLAGELDSFINRVV
jgi:phosphoglycerate dehydrogenase-like enzyme